MPMRCFCPSRELARAAVVEIPRKLDGVEQAHHPLAHLAPIPLHPETLDHAPNLPPDGMARVQRVERVLEHHLERPDALRAALAHRDGADVAPFVAHLAVGRDLEPHQHLGEGGLAAARFADDGHRLRPAGVEVQRLVGLDVAHPAAPDPRHEGAVLDLVVLLHRIHFEHGVAEADGVGLGRLRGPGAVVDLPETAAAHAMTVAVRRLDQLDGDHPAVAPPGREVLAARAEVAPLGPLVRQGELAADRPQRCAVLVGGGKGNAAEEPVGIGVPGVMEELVYRPLLHHLPRVHDGNPIADLEDQPQVVRDVDLRRAVLPADVPDEIDDPRFHRDVQRGGRLVEQQQGGVGEERHRDDRALLLSARELVGKGGEHALRSPAAGSRRGWRRRDRGPRARSPPRGTSGCP